MNLSKKVAKDLSAVRGELRIRGFSDDQIELFVEKISMNDCFTLLGAIENGKADISYKRAKRISIIASWCATYDRRRIFYWLRRRNVRTQEQLDEMAKVFSTKFEDRCPKIINSSLKRQAIRDVIRDIKASK